MRSIEAGGLRELLPMGSAHLKSGKAGFDGARSDADQQRRDQSAAMRSMAAPASTLSGLPVAGMRKTSAPVE